jgi:tetratricopeptide (TPR) repeat protein
MRGHGFYLLGNASDMAMRVGDWDWALGQLAEAIAYDDQDLVALLRLAEIRGMQGADVEDALQTRAAQAADLTEFQAPATVSEVRAIVALARGELQRALELAQAAYRLVIAPDGTALQTAARAAAWLGDADAVGEAVRLMEEQPGRVPAAGAREARAALAALEGRRGEALAGYVDALRRWRDLGVEVEWGLCALNLVTMLGSSDPEARSAAGDAAALFERLGSKALQERLAGAMSAPRPETDKRAGTSLAADARVPTARVE